MKDCWTFLAISFFKGGIKEDIATWNNQKTDNLHKEKEHCHD